MAKRRRRKGWIPEILWQLFRDKAHTLADTISSLIPQQSPVIGPEPTQCRQCSSGERCIFCSGEDRMSFLVRDDDPYEYGNLLKNCFVVVSSNAPPFGGSDTQSRLSQIEVVRRTIEMLLCEGAASTNLLCSGYNKLNRSSSIVELLNCSTWDLLLNRVGDGFMAYLLKWTSIFVPHTHTKFHQIAGPPVTSLCYKLSGHRPKSEFEQLSQFKPGSRKKRKTMDESSLSSEIENGGSLFGHTYLLNNNADNDEQNQQLSPNANEKKVNPKKPVRPFSWQRRRKRNKKVAQNKSLNPFTSVQIEKESSCMSFQCGHDTSSLQIHDKADTTVDEFEPLFDYRRVQPRINIVCLDDDDEDHYSPTRRKNCTAAVEKNEKVIPVVNCDPKEEDWLLPPPKFSVESNKIEGSTLKELRSKQQELLSFAQSAEDVLREVEESAKRECCNAVEFSLGSGEKQQIKAPCERAKVTIAFQDKEKLKRTVVYKDDKFERIFKLYADKYKLDLQRLTFSFKGDKIDVSATPGSFDMEDDDIIEVRAK